MPETRQISQGRRCKGLYSIHSEIYSLYKKAINEGRKKPWSEFRQLAYDTIYEKHPDRKWCDHRKGTCYCYGEMDKAVQHVQELIGGEVIS
jgi:hypothetical protein